MKETSLYTATVFQKTLSEETEQKVKAKTEKLNMGFLA